MGTTPSPLDPQMLKYCPGKRCPRQQAVLYSDRKYCSACGAKLKTSSWKPNGKNEEPLIDMEDAKQDPVKTSDDNKDRKHYTRWDNQLGKFECWCGQVGDWEWSRKHDELGAMGDPRNEAWSRRYGSFGLVSSSAKSTKTEKDDTFTCNPDVGDCPIVATPVVVLNREMFAKWQYLCQAFNTEWIAYLKGEEVKDFEFKDKKYDGYRITEMYFPKQTAGGAHVTAEEGEVKEGTIGAVHSHVDMGVFFSDVDKKHCNQHIELIVNRKGDITGMQRVQLKCGEWSRTKPLILLTGDEPAHPWAGMREELDKQLTQKTYNSYHSHGSHRASDDHPRSGAGQGRTPLDIWMF